jgi:hypothetical protein
MVNESSYGLILWAVPRFRRANFGTSVPAEHNVLRTSGAAEKPVAVATVQSKKIEDPKAETCFGTSRSNTPNAWLKPASSLPSAASATAMTVII